MKITNILTENVSFKGIYTYDLYIVIIVRVNRGIAISCHKGSIFNCTEAELSCEEKIGKISVTETSNYSNAREHHAVFQRGTCGRI